MSYDEHILNMIISFSIEKTSKVQKKIVAFLSHLLYIFLIYHTITHVDAQEQARTHTKVSSSIILRVQFPRVTISHPLPREGLTHIVLHQKDD